MKTLTLAIVIPVYNEENHLAACLDAIANQTVRPDEVIVVDNNSLDASRLIASRYPFVTLLTEPVQGLIAARNTGMNAAKSQLIGRINADARLAPDWVKRVRARFEDDKQLDGLAGIGYNECSVLAGDRYSAVFSQFYMIATEAFLRTNVLWGANMIVRRSAWRKVRGILHTVDSEVHEDIDFSLCMAGLGQKIIRDNNIVMHTTEQSYYYYPKLKEYMQRRWATRRLHIESGTYDKSTFRGFNWFQIGWRLAVARLPFSLWVASSPIAYPVFNLRSFYRSLGI